MKRELLIYDNENLPDKGNFTMEELLESLEAEMESIKWRLHTPVLNTARAILIDTHLENQKIYENLTGDYYNDAKF